MFLLSLSSLPFFSCLLCLVCFYGYPSLVVMVIIRVESAEVNDLIVQCLNPDDLCSDVSLCVFIQSV